MQVNSIHAQKSKKMNEARHTLSYQYTEYNYLLDVHCLVIGQDQYIWPWLGCLLIRWSSIYFTCIQLVKKIITGLFIWTLQFTRIKSLKRYSLMFETKKEKGQFLTCIELQNCIILHSVYFFKTQLINWFINIKKLFNLIIINLS